MTSHGNAPLHIARTAAERRSLLRGSRAVLWLVPGAVLISLSGVLLVLARQDGLAVAWTSLGLLVGLFAAMVMTAIVVPIGIRRATLFAWLLVAILVVSLSSAGILLALSAFR